MALTDSSNPLLPGNTVARRLRPWQHALQVGTPVALVITLFVILTPRAPMSTLSAESALPTDSEAVDFADKPKACSAYTLCKALAGDCCPNPSGVKLDCCNGGLVATKKSTPRPAPAPEPRPAPAPEPRPAAKPAKKESAPASTPHPKHSTAPAPAPSKSSPTPALDSVNGSTGDLAYVAGCKAHYNCNNFDGDCCPDRYGIYLNCCGGPPIDHTPSPSDRHADENPNPNWGCGLLGKIPGINLDGSVSSGTKRLLDGLKESSSFGKVTFWNYKLTPDDKQYLSSDFIFQPENWGMAAVTSAAISPGFDAAYKPEISSLFLQTNEPDIQGSCMGDVMGECTANCPPGVPNGPQCPVADLHGTIPKKGNAEHQCNCWQYSQATGAGFWTFGGCKNPQPLPTLWDDGDQACINTVMSGWKTGAALVAGKGYKFMTTPLIAQDMKWGQSLIDHACATCKEVECGCPTHFAFHFYAYDCQPDLDSGYKAFQEKIDFVKDMMEKPEYSFIKGAVVNEVGILNCADQQHGAPICVPNTGINKGSDLPNHACPNTASVIEKLLDIVAKAKTTDGRDVVKGFTWFNENMDGGTYNLQLFNADGSVNDAGQSYMRGCSKWAAAQAS